MHDIIEEATLLRDRIDTIARQLNFGGMQKRVHTLEAEIGKEDFWKDHQRAKRLSQEVSDLKKEIATYEGLKKELEGIIDLAKLGSDEKDHSIKNELVSHLADVRKRFEQLEFQLLLGGKYDISPAVVAIHAGTGGVDAQDWAEMLMRMILRFCEKRGFTTTILDLSRGQEAGIKSVIIDAVGRYAYGYLKSEHGVHRLVRQSPFNADALRQTSFALIEVLPELGELSPIVVEEKDLRIDVFRSSGHGGQSVNTTDSAVRITHMPTGIVVTCQNERSQHQNKATAMKILKAKLHQRQLEAEHAEKAKLRGEYTSAEWGNQIRSYVLHPYKLVKDHRTEHEETDPKSVLDGNIDGFIEAYLRTNVKTKVEEKKRLPRREKGLNHKPKE